jgi:hypothetical protein
MLIFFTINFSCLANVKRKAFELYEVFVRSCFMFTCFVSYWNLFFDTHTCCPAKKSASYTAIVMVFESLGTWNDGKCSSHTDNPNKETNSLETKSKHTNAHMLTHTHTLSLRPSSHFSSLSYSCLLRGVFSSNTPPTHTPGLRVISCTCEERCTSWPSTRILQKGSENPFLLMCKCVSGW